MRTTDRKGVARMTENRLQSPVAALLSELIDEYQDVSPEAVLVATVILSGLVDGDVAYFESETFKKHCNILPDLEFLKVDPDLMLEKIRRLYV